MMAFHPNGSVQVKVNICSCEACILGDLVNCIDEPGKVFFVESGEEDYELDFEEVDMVEDECQEEYEMRSSTVLEIIEKGDVVALYSDTSFDLFYLCKVISFGVAQEQLIDKYNHVIEKGAPYLEVQYYDKKSNTLRKTSVIYKSVKGSAYVQPPQVMCPKVNVMNVGTDIHIARDEFQWLCDSI